MTDPERVAGLVGEITPRAVELRHQLHRHPEGGHEEHQTTAFIGAALDESGIGYQLRAPRTGLWVDLGAPPSIGFRADLDALPISEPEDNSPVSSNPGWMHACGHDAHAAIAFGIAAVLDRLELSAGVRILFQPAEESFPGGAADLVEEGIVDGLKGLIAFHVDPTLPTGRIGSRSGPITASADKFTLVLEGPGGHTARPHRTVDLIAEAARVVHELPASLRRTIDARSPLTVAFGSIHGGEAGNVIPTRVEIQGTVRTLDGALWGMLPGLVDRALSSLLAISGADHTLAYSQAIPPVVNDAGVVQAATSGISAMLGPDVVVPTEPSMGGEDFSNYLTRVPGALFRLGNGGSGGDLHSPSFQLDEGSIGFGIHAGVAALLGIQDHL
ncbi:MAG TPA: amidohydrolase [Acidimicrobiia bacterium]|nr:amidohydrolase [Acidimicrobiia bacterium]